MRSQSTIPLGLTGVVGLGTSSSPRLIAEPNSRMFGKLRVVHQSRAQQGGGPRPDPPNSLIGTGGRLLPAGPIARSRRDRSTRPLRPRLIETIGLALPGQFRWEVVKKWSGVPLTPYDGLAILGSRPYREVPISPQNRSGNEPLGNQPSRPGEWGVLNSRRIPPGSSQNVCRRRRGGPCCPRPY